MEDSLMHKAFEWVGLRSGEGFLNDQEYCSTRDVFQARLDHHRIKLGKEGYPPTPLLIAVLGEVGNNAYDHNLGNWRDVPGIYFAAAFDEKRFVIADRGQGIRTTIQRVKPEVKDDQEALRVAFTEIISGRSPEQRGNGLKFVKSIVARQGWNLECYSSAAVIRISSRETQIQEYQPAVRGSIIVIDA